ncbi:hypothetical protein BC941DRAFT_194600 [Chlamydoabsidia padenii]|nr:hypothetical protein BC941DRAFT_194600 [Chlamydoabsidia padenii]
MKFSILSSLLAISAAAMVSAGSTTFSGTVYIYQNSIPHPKTTFLKAGSNGSVVTNGAGCKGNKTLSGKDGALTGTFTTVNNQWDFNGQHDNEINMGYVKINDKNCLTLTKGSPLSSAPCPSFSEEIKAGNKFAWFHDKRNSAIWAYGGDADAEESNGLNFDITNFQTTGKTVNGIPFHDDVLENTFLSLGYISLGHSGKRPTGCQ